MRLLTLSPQETAFLTREIKQKYEDLSGEELVITSYLARYTGLVDSIKSNTQPANGSVVVSTGLLRKLLENGKNNESTHINRQFIDTCYLFITDCQYTRRQYNDIHGPSVETETGDIPTSSAKWPFKGERVHFSMRKDLFILSSLVIACLLTWTIVSNWQFILLQVPSPAPKYRWWVAEYPDGTTVYNNFRRYRTETEVIDYFEGRGIEDGTHIGDCNAILWTGDTRINVCFDSIEGIRKFEEQHGGKPEIRFDG